MIKIIAFVRPAFSGAFCINAADSLGSFKKFTPAQKGGFMFFNLLADIVWYPTLFDSPINVLRGVAFWVTVALIVAFATHMLLTNGDLRKKCAKLWLIGAVIYACFLGIAFLWLTFSEDGIQPLLFIPLLILVIFIGASAITLYFTKKKVAVIVVISGICGALLAVLVCP